MEFLTEKENLIAVLVWAAFGFFFVVLFIMIQVLEMRYMKQQKETGSDKKKVLDAMREVMKEHFSDYTYAVGFYTKEDRSGIYHRSYYVGGRYSVFCAGDS